MLNEIQVYKLDENAITPTRNLATDAGLDLYALEDTFVQFETTVKVKTGIAVYIPPGYMGKIFSRSSLASRGLTVDAGVIDAEYAGECAIVLHNLTHPHGSDFVFRSGYLIKRGDKIAQLVVMPIETPSVTVINTLWKSDRGNSGFGSSGR
jgi:dUTP pyrophosphatase